MLRSKTAERCEKELWIGILAYNIIRILMSEAASLVNVTPRELSFKHTLQLILALGIRIHTVDQQELLRLISQKRVGNRPDRVEPRAAKRRPKPFRRLKDPRQIERDKILKRQGRYKKVA